MEQTLSTLSTQIGDLQKQIDTLLAQQKELRDQRFEVYLESVKSEVGKCFHNIKDEEYFKIVGVPRARLTKWGTIENEYEFPAFYITNEPEEPFTFDTVFYNVGCGIPLYRQIEAIRGEAAKCVQITQEEFNEVLEQRFCALKEQIK